MVDVCVSFKLTHASEAKIVHRRGSLQTEVSPCGENVKVCVYPRRRTRSRTHPPPFPPPFLPPDAHGHVLLVGIAGLAGRQDPRERGGVRGPRRREHIPPKVVVAVGLAAGAVVVVAGAAVVGMGATAMIVLGGRWWRSWWRSWWRWR